MWRWGEDCRNVEKMEEQRGSCFLEPPIKTIQREKEGGERWRRLGSPAVSEAEVSLGWGLHA